MKRAPIVVAAFLLLLFAFNPQPVHITLTAAQAATAGPFQWRPMEQHASRHTRTVQTGQVTTQVRPGDTYGKWATQLCDSFAVWPGIQQVNGWPERAIPVGATAVIVCAPTTTPPATKPATKPIANGAAWVHPLASGRLGTSCYRTTKRPGHNGVDIPQPAGTPIRAAAAGSIYRKAYQAGGAGHYLILKHAASIYTAYMHLRAPSPLHVGVTVATGQTIGQVGSTGNSTGPHLHFEVMIGYNSHTNPSAFMWAHGINIGC